MGCVGLQGLCGWMGGGKPRCDYEFISVAALCLWALVEMGDSSHGPRKINPRSIFNFQLPSSVSLNINQMISCVEPGAPNTWCSILPVLFV